MAAPGVEMGLRPTLSIYMVWALPEWHTYSAVTVPHRGHPAGAQTLLLGAQPAPAPIYLLISCRRLWVQSLLLWPLNPPLCCYSLKKYLWSICHVPGPAPVTGDSVLSQRDMVLPSWSLQSSREDKQKQNKSKQSKMVSNVRSAKT